MAPFATLIYLVVVTALVVGRRRWAWFLLTLLYAAAAIGWVFDPHRFQAKTLVFEALLRCRCPGYEPGHRERVL